MPISPTMRRTLFACVTATSLIIGLAAAAPAQRASAIDFGVPTAPTQVTAKVQSNGVLVTWTPSAEAAPAITHYVVHAGPDSCPVTVPATEHSALMPFIKGPTTIVPQVQAVNDYGFSANASAQPLTVPNRATNGYRNVQFLQFSDFHGAIESSNSSIGAATMAASMAANRSTVLSTFVVSSGDNIGGSPAISKEFAEVPTIEALNLMGLDISTFGNHEHDTPLTDLRRSIDISNFDWVVSDYNSNKGLLTKTRDVKEVVVLERGRVKVGFIGLNTADLASRVDATALRIPGGGQLRIVDSPARIARLVTQARAEGAELIVALVHRGWEASTGGQAVGPLVDAARSLPGVDVVFGGDSHQQYASIIGDRAVAQVPNSGQMYSRTVVCLDMKTNRPIGASIDFVTKKMVSGTPEDTRVSALVQRYRTTLTAKLDQRIGTVDGVFPRGGNPPVERSGETPMGNFSADAVRNKYGTDFALLNGGGIRDTLPAGTYKPADTSLRRPGGPGPYDVVLGDLLTVFPFGNNVATTTVTGTGLWQALENGVSKWPTDGRFPQVSGLRFTFDPTRPVGSRIVSVTKPDGTPIAADGTVYTITTVDYIINGGDGYGTVFSPTSAVMREPYVDAIIAAFRADLAAGRVTSVPKADGRIVNLAPRNSG